MTPPTPNATDAALVAHLALPSVDVREPEWLRERRVAAHAWLQANGLPGRHEEAWKYTPVRELASFEPVTANGAAGTAATEVDEDTLDRLLGTAPGPRLVLVNGRFEPSLSGLDRLPPGVTVTREAALDTAPPGDLPVASTPPPDQSRFDGFQALGQMAAPDGLVISVAPNTAVAEPVTVVHVAATGGTTLANHLRTVVDVGAASRLTFVEAYVAVDEGTQPYFTNAATTVLTAADATIDHLKVQLEAPGSSHVSHTAVRLDRGASLHSVSVALGAEIGRNAVDVVLHGDGASAKVNGLYVPTGTQRLDNAVTVEHLASHGTSDQLFKAVAGGKGKGSFIGRIVVQRGTIGTDANQTSRSLLLSRTAEADTRPWLEIFADDVACTHGAAVGRLDHEALFYLRTRGIPEPEARTLLIRAFVAELIDAITVPELHDHLAATITEKIALAGGPGDSGDAGESVRPGPKEAPE